MPPEGQNVLVTLDDSSEVMAYWMGGEWWMGVAYDPVDIRLNRTVISWRFQE